MHSDPHRTILILSGTPYYAVGEEWDESKMKPGCPVGNVPAGFSAQGLPMGLQILAPCHRDLTCLQLAHMPTSRFPSPRI
jgi:hypothetical protein